MNMSALLHRKPASTGISHNSLIAAVLRTVTKEMYFKLKFAWRVSVWDPSPKFQIYLKSMHLFCRHKN
jgi:hypothetical protein